ncbi:UNVERIFIED_CONTAM: UDP-glycosyltransferase 86A1 [Sesamum calycinum]|uniref:UDP-glycosyltransferase 86A1 n=1 Tax=Sesamum calycinum TaxID=2727403 RepID=A0AAW2NUB8_9LAMI
MCRKATCYHDFSPLPSKEFDIFSEARDSGLDIRYTTISDGFPLEFDRHHNVDEYWESMFHDFPSPIAKKYNLVNVSFWTEPALVYAINNYYFDLLTANDHFPPTDDLVHSIDYIPGVESISSKDLMPYVHEADTTTLTHKILIRAFEQVKKADFILHNTVQELELHTLSILNQKHPTYAIGPVNFSTDSIKTRVSKSLLSEIDCSKWLESKPPASVLYVSFGSIVQTNKQPTNRKLVVDDWKIGVNLCDGVSVDGAEVALKIKQLMSEKTSVGIRNEAMKLRSVLHDALAEEGSSNRNFDQFIQDLRHKMHVDKENVS